MNQTISEFLPQVIAIMQSEGVPLRDPASAEEISLFECRWNVSLPDDIRQFYAAMDGTGKDAQLTDDLFRIWPLSAVMPIPDLFPGPNHNDYRDITDASRFLCFADYMIDSDVFALHADESGTVITVCSGHRPVAASFTDFIAKFLFDRYSLL